jgi:hypothetical protein
MGDTTNIVEGLHSIRRKYADKRLNFSSSYSCRANLAVLATYLENWQTLVLQQMDLPVTPSMSSFFEVILLF